MMVSILREIEKLRDGKPMTIDPKNFNRYCIIAKEKDQSKTAYYFNTPIYNASTKTAVNLKFCQKDGAIWSIGSNAKISISKEIYMANTDGVCIMALDNPVVYFSEQEVRSGNYILQPTTNGILCKANCIGKGAVCFHLRVGRPFMEIRANNKCFSLMKEKFRPFVTVSAIGTADEEGNVIAPALISYQKIDDYTCALSINSCCSGERWVLFEINLYEPKLVQDTTVESLNSRINNVFGGTAFIGYTEEFGEQWLYTRLDFSKISELMGRQINGVTLHLPKLGRSNMDMRAFSVLSRFCSFGSNWDNKVATASFLTDSTDSGDYHSLDLTHLLTDHSTGCMIQTEGLILMPCTNKKDFSVTSTGDSHYAPQIWEINYL